MTTKSYHNNRRGCHSRDAIFFELKLIRITISGGDDCVYIVTKESLSFCNERYGSAVLTIVHRRGRQAQHEEFLRKVTDRSLRHDILYKVTARR